MFTTTFKQQAKNVERIDKRWDNHDQGLITLEEARTQVLEAADGINSESTNFSGAAEIAAEKRSISSPRAAEAALGASKAEAGQLQGQPETFKQDLEQEQRGA